MLKKGYILYIFTLCCSSVMHAQICNSNGINNHTFEEIKYLLDKNKCNTCHNSGLPSNTWHYETYADMISESACKTSIIDFGKANSSLLIDKLNGGSTSCGNAMPLGGHPIPASDLLSIENWINSGAPEFCLLEFNEVRSLLYSLNCGSCHHTSESWYFDSYSSIFNKSTNSLCKDFQVVTPYNAQNSLLYQKLNQGQSVCGQLMTNNGQPLSYTEIAKIRDWINAGTPVNAKALPVTLKELSLTNIQDERILIHWKTDSELNTEKFEIQHSVDGLNFTTFGSILSKGSVQTGSEYQTDHYEIRIGFNYYRLKIIDFNDSYTYSPIRVIQVRNNSEIFSIYPNPIYSSSSFNIEWYPTDTREKVKVFFMDITGKMVYETIINSGINYTQLPALKTGIYYMTIRDYNEQFLIKKLVVFDEN